MVRKLSEAMQQADQSNVDPSIIQACLAEYTQGDSELKRLAQRQAALLRRYEGQGVNVKSIKAAHRAAKLDKSAARAQAQSDMRYLVITGILRPADDEWVKQVSQSSLFDQDEDVDQISEPSPDLARARAYSDGYNSGRHGGEAINNPFQAGSSEYVSWEKGRTDGRADKALRPGRENTKQADTSAPRRGRGRPPGKKSNGTEAHA
jgi:hypothetical protein